MRLHGKESDFAAAVGSDWKGKVSTVAYIASIVLAFVDYRVSEALIALVAMMWLVPDRRFAQVALKHDAQ